MIDINVRMYLPCQKKEQRMDNMNKNTKLKKIITYSGWMTTIVGYERHISPYRQLFELNHFNRGILF